MHIHKQAITQYKSSLDARDPVALELSWSPARSGGDFEQNRKLVISGDTAMIHLLLPGMVETIITMIIVRGMRSFRILAILLSLPLLRSLFSNNGSHWYYESIALLCVVAIYLYSSASGLVTIDRNTGMFYSRNKWLNPFADKRRGSISDIHALQIVKEVVGVSDSDFISYELNLVFFDGSRLVLMDHRDSHEIGKSASNLSMFLNVPVWEIEMATSAGAKLAI